MKTYTEYVESGCSVCIFCTSTDLGTGPQGFTPPGSPGVPGEECSPGEAWLRIRCNECEAQWTEIYQLVSVHYEVVQPDGAVEVVLPS